MIVVPLERKHLGEVNRISAKLFGTGYEIVKESDNREMFAWVACKNDQVLGFITAVLVKGGSYYNIPLGYSKFVVIKIVGVVKEHRKKGMGAALVSEVIGFFPCFPIHAFAWRVKTEIFAHRLFVKQGFSRKYELGAIWKVDCDDQKFMCVERKDSCQCSAVLYTLQRDS